MILCSQVSKGTAFFFCVCEQDCGERPGADRSGGRRSVKIPYS